MFITKDPWVTLEFNESVRGAISRTPKDMAHFVLFGSKRPGSEGRYSPLIPELMPAESDDSDFAVVFRAVQTLVWDGVLLGPFGEDHPAVYARFEYSVPKLDAPEVLEACARVGLSVRVSHVKFGTPIKAFSHDKEAKLAALKESAVAQFGRWMDEETEFSMPRVDIEFTQEEKARHMQEFRETLARMEKERPFWEKMIDGVFYLLLWAATPVLWMLTPLFMLIAYIRHERGKK